MRSRINSSCPKADVKGIYIAEKKTTSSWLIVRLPLVSYVKVTYGSDINFRKQGLINSIYYCLYFCISSSFNFNNNNLKNKCYGTV